MELYEYLFELLRLKEQVSMTEDGNYVKIIPLDRHSFQTFPLDREYILLSPMEYMGLRLDVFQFNEDFSGVEPFHEDGEELPEVEEE